MKFLDIHGKDTTLNVSKYKLSWEKKSRSKPQFECKQFLKKYWIHDIMLEEMRVPKTRYTFDIVNLTKRIVIEVHGTQHFEHNKFFHENRIDFLQQLQRDSFKEEWARKNGFCFVEILESDFPLTASWFQTRYDIIL